MKNRCANQVLSLALSFLLGMNSLVTPAFASSSSSDDTESSARNFSTNVTLVVEGMESNTVTCDPNGGTWDDGTSGKKPQDVEDGKEFTVPDAPNPPDGQEFAGWKDGNGDIHQPGDKITPDGDMDLAAQWKDKTSGGQNPGGGGNGGGRPSGGGDGSHRPGGGDSKPGKPSAIVKPSNPTGVKAGGVDINGDPYRLLDGIYVAEEAYERGYMYGFSPKKFGPDDYLTRAQFAAIMDRVFEFDETDITKSFLDTKGHWAEEHITRLASRGVIYGVNENEFRPNDGLTKGHVLLMLGRVLNLAKYSKVSDLSSVKQYHAKEAIAQILNSGIYDDLDSNFDVNARITRSEMVHLMNNIIYDRNVKDVESEQLIITYQMFPDLTANQQHVFYYDCVKSLNDNYLIREVQSLEK